MEAGTSEVASSGASEEFGPSEIFVIDCSGPQGGADDDVGWSEGERAVLTFSVGQSEPVSRWPAFHPGPLNAATGWRDHAAIIEFEGPSARDGLYLLTLKGQSRRGPCPELIVDMNGHDGLWFLNPLPERYRFASRLSPISGLFCLTVALAGEWVAEGTNRLALTTTCYDGIDGSEKNVYRRQFGSSFGSGIDWEHLSLRHVSKSLSGEGELTVSATSLPLFQQHGKDLVQLVDVVVTVGAGGKAPDEVAVTLDGGRAAAKLDFGFRQFGQARVTVAVPELVNDTAATVECGGLVEEVVLRARRKWTLHLIPHVHLDIGYTDFQAKVEELHCRNLERAVSVQGSNPSFAFSVDGSFALKQFLMTRKPEAAQAVLGAIKAGRIGVNVFHSLFLTGLASLEECYRACYDAARLREDYGIGFEYANITDIPGYSSALPGILADIGIKEFMGIQNHDRGGTVDSDSGHLASPVVWEGVDGQRVLTFFADGYAQLRKMFGDPQTVSGLRQGLLRYLGRYEREDYSPDVLPIVGSHVDNEDLATGDAGVVERWNERFAFPHLVVSTIGGYFAAVRAWEGALPVWRGDGGSYWEDGVGASAGAVCTYRRAQVLLPVAESLAALVSHRSGSLRPVREKLDDAWESLLLGCEHTWTWTHAVRRPAAEETVDQLRWKEHYIGRAERVAVDELRRGLSQLGELVVGDPPALVVYNGLAWDRACDVEFEAPAGTALADGGSEVMLEEVSSHDDMCTYRCRVDVPGFGFRVLKVDGPLRDGPSMGADARGAAMPGDRRKLPSQMRSGGGRVTTRCWSAQVDPATGRLRSLVNRALATELCDQSSPWSIGEVLYVAGGGDRVARGLAEGGTSLTVLDRPAKPEPQLVVHRCQLRLLEMRRTMAGAVVRCGGSGPSLPAVFVEFALRDDEERVEVRVELEKTAELAKEALYVAFPFALGSPQVLYDRQQGWVRPATDHSPGASNEWFTTQYAVGLVGQELAVTWVSADAPLFTLGDVARGRWPTTASESGTVLSYVMNNYWPTNFAPSQSGRISLRYAFSATARWDPARAARLGREVRVAPAVAHVTCLDKFCAGASVQASSTGRLLELNLPANVVASAAQHRSGEGLVVRLQETAGGPATVRVPVAGNVFGSLFRCTADEVHLEELPQGTDKIANIELGAYRVVTLHLMP